MKQKRNRFVYISYIFQAISIVFYVLWANCTPSTPAGYQITMAGIGVSALIVAIILLSAYRHQFKRGIIEDKYVTFFILSTCLPSIIIRLYAVTAAIVAEVDSQSEVLLLYMLIATFAGSLLYYAYLAKSKILFSFRLIAINAAMPVLILIPFVVDDKLSLVYDRDVHFTMFFLWLFIFIIDVIASWIVALICRAISKKTRQK